MTGCWIIEEKTDQSLAERAASWTLAAAPPASAVLPGVHASCRLLAYGDVLRRVFVHHGSSFPDVDLHRFHIA